MCRSPSSIVAKWRARLAVLPVGSPVAGCTVAPLAETTGDALPPSRVRVVADVGGLADRSLKPSVWQGIPATAKMLGLTADEDCRCAETTDPENYRRHSGEFVGSGYDVIVPVGLALGDAAVVTASKHPDSANPAFQQPLPEMQVGFDRDRLATGHQQ